MKKISLLCLMVVFVILGIVIGTYLDKNLLGYRVTTNSLFYHLQIVVGAALFVVSVLSNMNVSRSILSLIEANDEPKKILKEGIYAYMKFPKQQLYLISLLSFALMSTSISFLLFIAPIQAMIIYYFFIYSIDMKRRLIYGDEYLEYSKSTPSICFKWSCIKVLMGITKLF